jgi:hypothetical protein
MPPKRLLSEEECPQCSEAQGTYVALGKGSTSCAACKKVHDTPPPLPKRISSGRPESLDAVRDPQAPVKMSQQQYATLMLWLVNDANRNIVTGLVGTAAEPFEFSHACTGAAGSATTGGNKFAGKAKVVPKTQGFAMMAAAINKDHLGSGWTADIASKKFLYLQGKYSAAKTASYRSDWGLSQAELTKGVTLENKLDGMCKDFCAWDKWFGMTQKYNPSDVQDSSAAVTGGASSATPALESDHEGEVEAEDDAS